MTGREKFEAWFRADEQSELRKSCAEGWAYFIWQAALASQQPVDDDWVAWAGGECPLRDRATVDVMWQDKTISRNCLAYFWDWDHVEGQENIIAYRVVKP